jgi:hypothetical protein
MGVKKQILPDRLDPHRIAPDQARRQMVLEQGDDRGTAGADRVGIAGGLDAVTAVQREQDGFLGHERLDGVGAQDLGRQVDLPQAHAGDGRGKHAGFCGDKKT